MSQRAIRYAGDRDNLQSPHGVPAPGFVINAARSSRQRICSSADLHPLFLTMQQQSKPDAA